MSCLKGAFLVTLAFGAIAATAVPATSMAALPNRDADPVVLTGVQVPDLIGAEPGDVVAFSRKGSWRQIPVQVDQRKIADYRLIRRSSLTEKKFTGEVYADAGTWTEADGVAQRNWTTGLPIAGTTGDPKLDRDDEIVFMARDAGSPAATRADPSGVVPGTRTPVRVRDPLEPGVSSFVYLFERSGYLDPAAGKDYVSYDWKFSPALASPYKSAGTSLLSGYNFGSIGDDINGPPVNPEASIVTTDLYEQTFPARWMVNGLRIKAANATGVNILDGDKTMVGPFGCGRNELTFSRGGGGAIANIDGPVRAIRSYVGANSGTFTQRDQIYYEGLAVSNTYLRVHQGITDFILATDYNQNAFGMTYRNSAAESGVTIDGVPDLVNSALPPVTWEQATGAQGTLTNLVRVDTDVPGTTFGSYYQDNIKPESNSSILCSGDDHAIGASGPRIRFRGSGFNTDPTMPPTPPSTAVNKLTGHRFVYYGPPNESVVTAKLRSRQVDSPLVSDAGKGVEPAGPTGPTGPTGSDPTSPGRQNWVGLKIRVSPVTIRARIGATKKFRVKVRNIGDQVARKVRICPVAAASLVWTGKCVVYKKLKPDRLVTRTFRVKLRRAASARKQVKVRFRAKSTKSKARSATTLIRPVG